MYKVVSLAVSKNLSFILSVKLFQGISANWTLILRSVYVLISLPRIHNKTWNSHWMFWCLANPWANKGFCLHTLDKWSYGVREEPIIQKIETEMSRAREVWLECSHLTTDLENRAHCTCCTSHYVKSQILLRKDSAKCPIYNLRRRQKNYKIREDRRLCMVR